MHLIIIKKGHLPLFAYVINTAVQNTRDMTYRGYFSHVTLSACSNTATREKPYSTLQKHSFTPHRHQHSTLSAKLYDPYVYVIG